MMAFETDEDHRIVVETSYKSFFDWNKGYFLIIMVHVYHVYTCIHEGYALSKCLSLRM